jgi:hypothetical protein
MCNDGLSKLVVVPSIAPLNQPAILLVLMIGLALQRAIARRIALQRPRATHP